MKNLTKQKGFTLIELVVVIVILGILAVTAAPKFIDLQDDARTATLNGVKASMQSASSLVYSKSLIAGNETAAPAATTVVTINGTPVEIGYGYPLADYSGKAAGSGDWSNLLDVDANDFLSVVVSGELFYYPANQTAPTADTAECIVIYTPATATVTPQFDVNDC
jgi:MSHA pilin protein MshA